MNPSLPPTSHSPRRHNRGRWTLATLLALTTSCAQLPGGGASPQPDPVPTLTLSAQPDALVFSGTADGSGAGASVTRTVTLSNNSGAPVQLRNVLFDGASSAFGLVSPPSFPRTLAAGQSLNLNVRLLPGSPTGVLRATLSAVGDAAPIVAVPLAGLRAAGLEGSKEPALAQIVDTLDYRIDVGGSGLILSTGAGLIGEEVAAPLFERASAAPVTLRPVARYSPDGPSVYGSFVLNGGAAQTQPLGTMAAGGHQTLNPPLTADSRTIFDPGGQPFGIYLAPNSYAAQDTFTLDRLNTGRVRHAVRTYPLRNRAGQTVANSYLLGFEPSENGDYQDVVFVLENVRPVADR